MKIEAILNQYNVFELREYLSQLNVEPPDDQKKQAVLETLANHLLDPQIMKSRLSVISDDDFDLFMQAIQDDVELTDDNIENGIRLSELDYVGITDEQILFVPDDVKEVFEKLDFSEFMEIREENFYLRSCLILLGTIYGGAPMWVLQKMYETRKGAHISEEEFLKKYKSIPQDLNPCIVIGNIVIDRYFAESKDCKERIDAQKDELFYIPNKKEIRQFQTVFSIIEEESYLDLLEYMTERFDSETSLSIVSEVYGRFAADLEFSDFFEWIDEREIVFKSEIDKKKLIEILMKCYEDTRMQAYQGHTINEMRKLEESFPQNEFNVIKAYSTEMAELLKKFEKMLDNMGIKVDYKSQSTEISSMAYPDGLDGRAIFNTRRVFPKDYCPCGSGKEYKYCCLSKTDNSDFCDKY